MANLNVEPKKKGSMLPWIIGAAVLLLLLFFLLRGCNDDKDEANATTTDNSAATSSAATAATTTDTDWSNVDFNAPTARYDEITDTAINVRGNDNYGIYGLGENILFDKGEATIRSSAEANLKQIAGSIDKRYKGGNVRLYGYADATGNAGTNKELSEKRVEAVRNWLVKNGNISSGNITLHPVGETQPAATNSTEEGRQLNRRVEIVAKAAGTGK